MEIKQKLIPKYNSIIKNIFGISMPNELTDRRKKYAGEASDLDRYLYMDIIFILSSLNIQIKQM